MVCARLVEVVCDIHDPRVLRLVPLPDDGGREIACSCAVQHGCDSHHIVIDLLATAHPVLHGQEERAVAIVLIPKARIALHHRSAVAPNVVSLNPAGVR
jgi:hypothetical protein